ncbi:hypothetical protein P7K49_014249, partial [Saguinus oedipus]
MATHLPRKTSRPDSSPGSPALTSSPVFSAKPQHAGLVSSGFPSFCPRSHWAENDD